MASGMIANNDRIFKLLCKFLSVMPEEFHENGVLISDIWATHPQELVDKNLPSLADAFRDILLSHAKTEDWG